MPYIFGPKLDILILPHRQRCATFKIIVALFEKKNSVYISGSNLFFILNYFMCHFLQATMVND